MDKKLPKVFVKTNYELYVVGEEVIATADSPENIFEGDHVLVFKDSISATSSVAVPREKQADYIGLEGIVTKLTNRTHIDGHTEPKTQLMTVKIL